MSIYMQKVFRIALTASLLVSVFGCATTETEGWVPAPSDAVYVCWGGTGSKARKKVADPEPRICECRPRHELNM
jgi:hypothetical protein